MARPNSNQDDRKVEVRFQLDASSQSVAKKLDRENFSKSVQQQVQMLKSHKL